MQTRKILSSTLAAAATLSMLAACGPAPTQNPEPSASPSVDASAEPSATPSEEPSTEPSATPSEDPSTEPSAEPTASAEPSAEPTATAVPSATLPPTQEDISVIEKTTFNGKVFDDTEAPLDGVTVTAKSLNSSVAYEVSTTTAGGTYAFNNAPAGVQIEITASRSGYTTRRRVEVLKSNKQGDPDANRYDFGTDGASEFGVTYNALSDKPEVTMVTPGRNAAGIDPGTSFVLKFSEPMDRKTVTDNFEIRAYTTEQLTVDDETTFFGAGSISNDEDGSRVWDKGAFNASWNSDDTEVTMTFKEERMLPTDKDSDLVPDYQVSFNRTDAQLKDKSGITRASEFFKLTDGNFEQTYKFSIETDEDKPEVESIVANSNENSSGTEGDVIKVRFSERMVHYTLAGTIAGGMEGTETNAPAGVGETDAMDAANNYYVSIDGGPEMQWGSIMDVNNAATSGNLAVFDSSDPTHKTVLLTLNDETSNIFEPGADIEVRVATTVLDPAGNSVDSSSDDASAVAS